MKRILIIAISLFTLNLSAQNLVISDDSTYSGTSNNALFEVHSANGNKGILIPRLTTTQRTSIATTGTDEGLVVYDTDTHSFWVWGGSQWTELGDKQTLSLSGNQLNISNGNSVDLSAINSDNQTLSLSGNNLTISNGNTVDLSQFMDNTDDQNLSISGHTLSIENGNSVTIPDNDNQTLSLSGNTLSISGGNSVDLSSYLDNTDNQTLTLSGNTLSISGGNSVDISSAAWSLTGNSISSGQFLGTTNNQNLFFRTNDTTRVVITSDGKIGMGTVNPTELLELHGGGIQLNDTMGIGFNNETPYNSPANGDKARIYYQNDGTQWTGQQYRDFLVIEKTDANNSYPDGGIAFANRGSDNLSNLAMVIRGSGNIGIGTGKPDTKLHIVQDEQKYALHLFNTNDITGNGLLIASNGGDTDDTLFRVQADLNDNNYTRFIIIGNGKVGIGTDDPDKLLTVDGDARIVGNIYYNSSGSSTYNKPDYVFLPDYDKNYNINYIERYIKKHGHLPWVTAAKDEKDGINMTRMSFETLEAVENLQLQILELNKEKTALQHQNKKLIKEIEQLKKQNEEILKRLNKLENK